MTTRLTLIKDAAEWGAYCKSTAEAHQLDPASVNWGSGPQEYPTLVASYAVSRFKIVSCYVYAADAVRLLDAKGLPAAVPVEAVKEVVPAKEAFRSYTAHLLTVVKVLVDTGIIKPEQYEGIYSAFLADVDQVEADDKKHAAAILARINRDC